MKSIESDMNIVSPETGSTADPSSTHLIGTECPVPAVLVHVVLSDQG